MGTKTIDYFTASGVIDRGWTRSAIDTFLGKPDQLKRNPYYRSAAPMRCYKQSRVTKIEKTDGFIDWKEKSEKRSNSLRIAAQKKRELLLSEMDSLNISVKKYSIEKLYKLACHHYNQLWQARDEHYKHASVSDSQCFLDRIAVNFLRHSCTKYEDVLEGLFRKVGKQDAYLRLCRKIYNAIGNAYPSLYPECDTQFQRKIEGNY